LWNYLEIPYKIPLGSPFSKGEDGGRTLLFQRGKMEGRRPFEKAGMGGEIKKRPYLKGRFF
jgi:hypothetical protein